MHAKYVHLGLASLMVVTAMALAGCSTSDGDDTAAAPAPPPADNTPPVQVPSGPTPIHITANTPPATFAALAPKVTVGRVTIASGPPVVDFSVTDVDGNAIIGLGSTSKSSTAIVASYPNFSFAIAKLVPPANGSPSKWVSYIVTSVPSTTSASAPSRPSTDNTGTLVDHRDGTYTYTFYRDITKVRDTVAGMTVSGSNNKDDLGDLTFEPTLVHRVTIQFSGSAPGTGTNTPNGIERTPSVPLSHPVNAIYDFVPATGQAAGPGDPSRDIVATAKCNECHRQLSGIPGDDPESSAAGFHGGNRNETRYCVVCHTDQRKYGRTEAPIDASTLTFKSSTYVVDGRTVGNLPNHIHKTHLGPLLAKKNYDYGGLKYNETLFPQDIRNCTKCHDGSDTSTAKTAQGDNWKNMPSRIACGACHDGINFATGQGVTLADASKGLTSSPQGHAGGPQADDSACALCHKPASIDTAHLPVTPPNPDNALLAGGTNSNTNAAWIASNLSRLPAGAIKITHDIKSVSVNASRQPVMVFRMLQDGTPTPFKNPTSSTEIWDNFMGAPSVYFAFSAPEDGIAAPADFNVTVNSYLRSLWNGTASGNSRGTLTGPDANGYYTATLTGVTIPVTASMLTGGLGYSYSLINTLPLTQTNLAAYPTAPATGSGLTPGMPNRTGGLIVVAPNAQKVADGYTGRRPIVEDARCNKCHQELGLFTKDSFHGGQRNDATTCSWCHHPNRSSSGWSADSISFVHAIHASAKRTVPFTWDAKSTTESFANVKFPGILKDCETCHQPGTYDFSAASSASALPNRLYRTTATGVFPALGQSVPTYRVSGSSCVAGNPSTGTELSVFELSPYVTRSTATAITSYGSGYSFNAGLNPTSNCTPEGAFFSVAPGTGVDAAPTTLVNSPIAAACVACHDDSQAMSHMRTNGGSVWAPRSVALVREEQCLVCHGSGRIADIKQMHMK
jgi:OmcA/MtrC family decaheme c-type cytochrome